MPKTNIGVAWLGREDWPQWQALDPEVLPYLEWLAAADKSIAGLKEAGVVVEKVTVDPMTFARWCLAEGKKIGSEARAAYAAAELAKRDRRS